MSREELRGRNIEMIGRWLAAYARQGHVVRLERRPGSDPETEELAFLIEDWPAFIAIMDGRDEDLPRAV